MRPRNRLSALDRFPRIKLGHILALPLFRTIDNVVSAHLEI